jgi:hypothetical protein
MKYEVDEELEAWLNPAQGANGVLFKNEHTDELLQKAMSEAFATEEGRELRARVGHSFDRRIVDELAKRSAVPFYPGVFFRSRIEEVLHDLLSIAPPAPPRALGVNEYGVNLSRDAATVKPAPTKEQTGFAFAWRKTVREKGITATKPRAGVVYLTMPNGSSYEYPVADATKLLDECIALDLIK